MSRNNNNNGNKSNGRVDLFPVTARGSSLTETNNEPINSSCGRPRYGASGYGYSKQECGPPPPYLQPMDYNKGCVNPYGEMMDPSFPWAKIFIVETIATAFLFICILIVASNSTDVLTIGIVHGFALAAVIGTFSSENAGFCNPLVVVILCAIGELFPKKRWAFLIYWMAEAVGALLAVLMTYLLTPDLDASSGLGSPVKSNQIDAAQGLLAETLGSIMLYSCVAWVTCLSKYYKTHGVQCGAKNSCETDHYVVSPNTATTIGLWFTAIVVIIAPYTGASLNIFRWFFPKVVSNTWVSDDWIYFVGPVLGALLSGVLAWVYCIYWKPKPGTI